MVSLCNAPTRDAGHKRDGLSQGKKSGQEQRQEAGSWLQGMTCCRAKPRQCRKPCTAGGTAGNGTAA